MVADAAEVRRAVTLFADPDPASGFQIVALPTARNTVLPGSDPDGAAVGAESMPAGYGVYFQINPVRPDLATKAKAADVLRRRWLFIDVDPVRAEGHKDDPATDAEKAS